jgi:hypothetical protein
VRYLLPKGSGKALGSNPAGVSEHGENEETFGVWYGCSTAQTSVHETAYHWYSGLSTDAGFEKEKVIAERKLYAVACDAALVDLRMRRLQFDAASPTGS